MSRYIDADALRDKLGRSFIDMDDCHFECPAEINGMLDYAIDCVKEQPTADVVEVVRCKDCIHHKPFPFSDEHICDVFDWKSEDKDFCSFAERRKE